MKTISSTMAGSIFLINIEVGDQVAAGQDIIILESMKMEVPVTSNSDGVVKEIRVQVGDFVNEGDPLVIIE
ncbi:acetyl-CoA carboxylase biotin carboxyl carrier protein subunit [Bacillus horti]|uniref:Acetyl-CoA carboxylase biotin carboxyl carrier protein n=1 Tax=Caldalkalibacillus horti TaxID=77523 RepID=A0ABT9VUC7_9BACI|nr:acetyl-CoA carboxylase biotin carboxyl carrier protein subunit [Bacillus horti]MDQ0164592.1 acetyl-CoA carboxylase biotin carboxyl carrier protein [Bacillus horti]